MESLVPLFAVRNEEGQVLPVLPDIRVGHKKFKALPLIEEIAGHIQEEASAAFKNDRTGEMTVVTYILLETLAKLNATKLAESLLDNPPALYQASLYATIGWLAGQYVPEGMTIGTEISESSASIRKLIRGDEGEVE